jgi:hypothetical protein
MAGVHELGLPFAYYARLSRRDQGWYRRSDAVPSLPLPPTAREALGPAVDALRGALAADDAAGVAAASATLAAGVSQALGAPPPVVHVLAVRPHGEEGELHGLYTLDPDETAIIRVWMRTARQGRVVAFRTYLRTLLHEVCHHLDFTALALERSFHTEGFFQRESSLFRQLVPDPARPRGGRGG